jgi:hypothetical protein
LFWSPGAGVGVGAFRARSRRSAQAAADADGAAPGCGAIGDPSNPAYAALFRRLSYLPPAELTATMQQTSEKLLEYLAGQQMVFTFIRQDPAFHAAFMAKALPHFRSVYEHSQTSANRRSPHCWRVAFPD